ICFPRGKASQIEGELLRFPVILDQVKAPLLSDHKQLLAIERRYGSRKHERPHCELYGCSTAVVKPAPFADRPDILSIVARRLEQEILSIRCPAAVRFFRRFTPVRQ